MQKNPTPRTEAIKKAIAQKKGVAAAATPPPVARPGGAKATRKYDMKHANHVLSDAAAAAKAARKGRLPVGSFFSMGPWDGKQWVVMLSIPGCDVAPKATHQNLFPALREVDARFWEWVATAPAEVLARLVFAENPPAPTPPSTPSSVPEGTAA